MAPEKVSISSSLNFKSPKIALLAALNAILWVIFTVVNAGSINIHLRWLTADKTWWCFEFTDWPVGARKTSHSFFLDEPT